jgi:hypothetical protein
VRDYYTGESDARKQKPNKKILALLIICHKTTHN